MTDSQLAWAWCVHVDHRNPSNMERNVRGLAVWHKVAAPWSVPTVCGQDSRLMAPLVCLRTTNLIGRPARMTEPDVQPFGYFCETCQSYLLHTLIPPGFPAFVDPSDARVASDWWLDAGEERKAELCRAIANPHWRPDVDADAVIYGPWGRPSRRRVSHWFGRIDGAADHPEPGLAMRYQSICMAATRSTLAIAWESEEPSNPCRECLAAIRATANAPPVSLNYAPYRR